MCGGGRAGVVVVGGVSGGQDGDDREAGRGDGPVGPPGEAVAGDQDQDRGGGGRCQGDGEGGGGSGEGAAGLAGRRRELGPGGLVPAVDGQGDGGPGEG